MKKVLSICIGCNKQGFYFQSTINSLIALLQKYQITNATEILICNDSKNISGDFAIAKKYKKDFPKLFRLFNNKENKGIAYTYQFLLFKSKGEFFMPFDSDDIVADFDIVKSIQFLQQNQKYIGSYGLKKIFNNQGQELGVTGGQSDLFNFGFYCNHNAMILKTQQAKQLGGYYTFFLSKQLKVACDVAMWANMYIHKDLYFQNCLRCYGRQHQNNHSQKNFALYDYQYNVLKQDIISYYNKKNNCAEDNLMIIAQGILKHSYTITEIQQMFFQRMPHSVLFSKYVFNEYVQFLKRKGLVAQVVSAILYGSIYNKQLSKVILQFCQNNKYISKNLHNFSLLYNNFATYVNAELQYDNWFKKFFIKISNQKII